MGESTGHHSAHIPSGGELVLRNNTNGTVVSTVPEQQHTQAAGGERRPDGSARTGELVVGDLLLTVNAPEGSTLERLPEDRRPAPPAATPTVTGPARYALSGLLEREEQCARLRELLGQRRSVRLTGPHGSGRTAVLDAVATSCAALVPGGVIRLSARHKPLGDVLQALYEGLGGAPGHRPSRRELPGLLAGIRAIVLVDDVDFGGEALDDLLGAAPDCAYLIAATPETPTPSVGAIEESRLGGLTRAASLALLAKLAGRSLDESERAWAVDLWFESEGLPLRFVQAAALLRHREVAIDALAGGLVEPDEDPVPLPSVAESAAPAVRIARGLGEPARRVLELASALGGEIPTPPHLPALVDVGHGEAAVEELVEAGLAEATSGSTHRLVEGAAALLAEEWPAVGLAAAAQHFTWWTGHSSVTEAQIAAEAEVLLAVLRTDQEAGRHDQVVPLARACAPSFALALHWGAWERALRYGLESARATGSVPHEAWFHHELGVLTFGAGAYERSRAELEASVALRGALADTRGTANGRHVLELLDQALVLSGATAVGAARGREERLRRFAPFASLRNASRSAAASASASSSLSSESASRQRPMGRHALDIRNQPATRRQLALAAGGVVLMGILGAGVAVAVGSLGDGSSPSSGTPVLPADNPTVTGPGFPSVTDIPTDSNSPSASASATHRPSASPSASGTTSTNPHGGRTPSGGSTTPSSGTSGGKSGGSTGGSSSTSGGGSTTSGGSTGGSSSTGGGGTTAGGGTGTTGGTGTGGTTGSPTTGGGGTSTGSTGGPTTPPATPTPTPTPTSTTAAALN